MSGIQGKVIAITGASSGIGEAAARELSRRGAHVVLGARRTDRLGRLLTDDELARRMGEAGIAWARRFHWDESTRKTLTLLEEAVAEHRAVPGREHIVRAG